MSEQPWIAALIAVIVLAVGLQATGLGSDPPAPEQKDGLAEQIVALDGGPAHEMESGLQMLAAECPEDYGTLAREGLTMARILHEDGHEDYTFASIVAVAYAHVLANGSTDCVADLNVAGVAYLNAR